MWTITGTNWTLTPTVLFLFLGLPEFKATLLLSFPVGQFEEADPERVFEKNGQRALAAPISELPRLLSVVMLWIFCSCPTA